MLDGHLYAFGVCAFFGTKFDTSLFLTKFSSWLEFFFAYLIENS
jgi:hypothetical protein